jgi:hypothetical protein
MLNHKSRQQTSYIPEPTIWYMFDSLAMAGLAMEQKLEAEPGQLFKPKNWKKLFISTLSLAMYSSVTTRDKTPSASPCTQLANSAILDQRPTAASHYIRSP